MTKKARYKYDFINYTIAVMRSILLAMFMGVYFGVSAAHGDWSLETLKDGAILSLTQREFFPDPGLGFSMAEFSFVCDKRSKIGNMDAVIFPFDGTYNNQETKVPVLIEPSRNPNSSNSFYREWGNGYKYIFLNQQDAVKALIEYLKTSQMDVEPFVNVLFSGDYYGRTEKPENMLRIVVGLSNFSDSYNIFVETCASR